MSLATKKSGATKNVNQNLGEILRGFVSGSSGKGYLMKGFEMDKGGEKRWVELKKIKVRLSLNSSKI